MAPPIFLCTLKRPGVGGGGVGGDWRTLTCNAVANLPEAVGDQIV